jgi:ATP-dependent helicase/nuclease subunit B
VFELDVKEQGSFQHDALAIFHGELSRQNKRWRDISPSEARKLMAGIARALTGAYRDGLFQATEQGRFMARVLGESLQDFVEVLVGWMRQQYQFDPVAVEIPFGADESSPSWKIPLGNGHRLDLYGRIDRVDICRPSESGQAACVVVDYKSSQKQLDEVLMRHGLQLQLLAYLNVIRHWPEPRELFGAASLLPVGVFYVNLRGKYRAASNRADALAETAEARKMAYRHLGRFDAAVLRHLDSRSEATEGDQFNYRVTQGGKIHGACREPMPSAEFTALLDSVEENLKNMGREIFSGLASVSPYRKGSATACDQCGYQSICRIDPWTHTFRVLNKPE